jgi:MFS family permease
MKKVSEDNHNNNNRRFNETKGNDKYKFVSKFLFDYFTLSSSKSSSEVMSTSISIPTYAWKTLLVLSCIAVMVMYAETMLIPAIPDLIRDFHVSYSMSSWILTAYLISGAVMTPIAGKLSDMYGKKKMLLIIMVIYGVGVSAAGFSNGIIFMLVARAIQGIGLSMFPIAFSIVREQFPRQKIAIGQGIISSMFAAGSSIGLYVGGTIIQQFSWHATFFTIIPILIILLFTIWRFINIKKDNERSNNSKRVRQIEQKQQQQQQQEQHQEQRHGKVMEKEEEQEERTTNNNSLIDENVEPSRSMAHIDFKGAVSLAVTIISFLLILTYSQTNNNIDNYTSSAVNINVNSNNISYNTNNTNNTNTSAISLPQVLILLAIGIISLMGFIIIEKRAKNPLIDLRLMLNKAILPANLIIMIFGICMFSIFQTIPILTRAPEPIGFGGNAINAGNVQVPFALILLIFGSTSGFLISKFGSVKPIIAGAIIMIAGFFVLSLSHSSEIAVSAYLAIVSAGMSLINVGAMNVVTLATPIQSIGVSLGMNMLIRIIGSSIGPAIAGMYMQMYQSRINIHGLVQHFPSTSSFDLIFISSTVLSIASLTLALTLRKRITKMKIPNLH